MSQAVHPAAPHHMPGFITAPGETDLLLIFSLIALVAIIVGIGVFYFKLHALPEQIAHKTDKIQFQVVAVLALLALFTHNHTYWIAALMLSLIRLPDLTTPLGDMAGSLARMAAGRGSRAPAPPAEVAAPKAAKPAPKRGPKKPATAATSKTQEAGDV